VRDVRLLRRSKRVNVNHGDVWFPVLVKIFGEIDCGNFALFPILYLLCKLLDEGFFVVTEQAVTRSKPAPR
jgi:hypothetical protein